MSDIKLDTERELILAKREGWAIATCAGLANFAGNGHSYTSGPCERCKMAATEAYPFPKVTRPRVVKDGDGDSWRWTPGDGLKVDRGSNGTFVPPSTIRESAREVVGNLLLNPAEEVEE